MTAEEVWISIGASILVVFLVFVIAKQLWNPIAMAESIGWYPLGVRQRVQDQLEDAVERLVEMRREFHHLDPIPFWDWHKRDQLEDAVERKRMEFHRPDPIPWSQRCDGWARRERDLLDKIHVKAAAVHSVWGLLIPSHNLGMQADEELKKANDLIQEGKQLLEEQQARSRSVRAVLHSCERKVRDVIHIDNMNDDDSSTHRSGLVGIFGMPGVGKTFFLELFFRDFQSPAEPPVFFEHVLFVRAGRGATVGTMQKAIAAGMGLTSTTDAEIYQRSIIYNQLRGKSFLLLIDDLRECLDLERVGIPMPLGSVPTDAHVVGRRQNCLRKVVFTTRSYHVCIKMGCANNTILLECWSEDYDTRKLFEDKLGNDHIMCDNYYHLRKGTPFVSELNFESTEQLVDECHGLPLALSTIGRAMSTKKDPKEWESAIDLVEKLKLRHTIIMSNNMYGRNRYDLSSSVNRHDGDDDFKELRQATDLGLLKTVLALVVMLTPVPKDRIIRYILLKEIDLPSLHGMASYQKKVLGFVEADETCSFLGIWGVRGVGKTTLLRFVRDYAHDDLFPYDAFFVGAGSGCTVRRLQHALRVSIGLLDPPPPPHMSDQASLAQLISNSLQGRPFLLLLDDVRERLDLAALGLPMPLKNNQKVIFTTRNKAICTGMGCTKDTSIIHMKCLGKEDACNLFKNKVADEIIDSHSHIRRLAEQMAAECHGLPSVLCTLGRAMSTKRDVREWRYAYDALLKMKPPHQVDETQEEEDERYNHLYHLEDKLLKHSFF